MPSALREKEITIPSGGGWREERTLTPKGLVRPLPEGKTNPNPLPLQNTYSRQWSKQTGRTSTCRGRQADCGIGTPLPCPPSSNLFKSSLHRNLEVSVSHTEKGTCRFKSSDVILVIYDGQMGKDWRVSRKARELVHDTFLEIEAYTRD